MDLYSSPGNRIGSITGEVLVLNISVSKEQWQKNNPGRTFTETLALAFVQRAWKLNPKRANKVRLIFACAKDASGYRKIEGVFRIGRNGNDKFINTEWEEKRDRYVFLAEPADFAECEKYLGKYLPPREQGIRNPVKYIDDFETQDDENVEFID